MTNFYLTKNKLYIVNNETKHITKYLFFNDNNYYNEENIIDIVLFNNPKIENLFAYLLNIIFKNKNKNSYLIFDEYWFRQLVPRFEQLKINKTILNFNNCQKKHTYLHDYYKNTKIFCYDYENIKLSTLWSLKIKRKNLNLSWSITNIYLQDNDNNCYYTLYSNLSNLFQIKISNINYVKTLTKINEIEKYQIVYNIDNLCNNYFINNKLEYNWTVRTLKPTKLIIIEKNKKQDNVYKYD